MVVPLLFALIGVSLGCFQPFLSVFLAGRGLEPSSIGFVNAIGAAALTVALPIWGHLADVAIGRRQALQCAALAALLAATVIALDVPVVVLAVGVVALSSTAGTFGSLNDSIALDALPDPPRQYGRMRLLTSIAFALSVLAAGYVYQRTSYGPGPLVLATICGLIALVASRAPSMPRRFGRPHAQAPIWRQRPSLGSVGRAFAIQPRLLPLLLALVLIHIGVLVQFTFLPLRIEDLGGSAPVIAGASAMSGLMEIPGTFAAAWIVKRRGLRALFVLCAFAYSAGLVGWAVATDLGSIVVIRAMSGFWFAGLAIGAVLTMRALLPGDLQATGQTLYQMVAFGLAAITSNILGGLVYESVGPGAPFGAAAAAGFVAVAVGWKVMPSTRGGGTLRA